MGGGGCFGGPDFLLQFEHGFSWFSPWFLPKSTGRGPNQFCWYGLSIPKVMFYRGKTCPMHALSSTARLETANSPPEESPKRFLQEEHPFLEAAIPPFVGCKPASKNRGSCPLRLSSPNGGGRSGRLEVGSVGQTRTSGLTRPTMGGHPTKSGRANAAHA